MFQQSKGIAFGAAALALAAAAQWSLNERAVIPSLGLYGAAIALVLSVLKHDTCTCGYRKCRSETSPTPLVESTTAKFGAPYQWLALGACVLCALFAFTLNADTSFLVSGAVESQFTLPGVVAWFASIILFLIAFWQPEKDVRAWLDWFCTRVAHADWRAGVNLCLSWTTLILLAILALGAVFYFYRLDATPAEMTSDHAEKLLDVNDILAGHTPLFFNRNTGREPLQFYLTAALIKFAGIPLSHLALKFGTALIGFLTIPATFLLAREMFDDRVGLLAAFFAAVLHWPVTIARMGLRYPCTTFFAAISLYFVWRVIKYQKRNDFLMAGFWLGLGLYGYIPSRNVPLLAVGLCILYALMEWKRRLRSPYIFILNLVLMVALIVIVFLPLLRFSLDYPDMFWYRALTRVASTEKSIEGNAILIFAKNLVNLALMFNWRGDEVWVTNISGQPTLDLISGALLILGCVIAVYRLFRADPIPHSFLLISFVVLLSPSALALAFPRENPSLVRTDGAIPLAAILLALPLALLMQTFGSAARPNALKLVSLALVLVPVIALNYRWYFVEYDTSYRRSAQNSSEVAAVIRSFGDSIGSLEHAYFIGYPHWLDGRAVAINLNDIQWKNFTLDANEFLQDPDDSINRLYIVHPHDVANLAKLSQRYPWGQTIRFSAWTAEKDFAGFFAPALSPH
jgi:4-amino-4-deoxy-L-arabinose transferase-like glycosyltransferase